MKFDAEIKQKIEEQEKLVKEMEQCLMYKKKVSIPGIYFNRRPTFTELMDETYRFLRYTKPAEHKRNENNSQRTFI